MGGRGSLLYRPGARRKACGLPLGSSGLDPLSGPARARAAPEDLQRLQSASLRSKTCCAHSQPGSASDPPPALIPPINPGASPPARQCLQRSSAAFSARPLSRQDQLARPVASRRQLAWPGACPPPVRDSSTAWRAIRSSCAAAHHLRPRPIARGLLAWNDSKLWKPWLRRPPRQEQEPFAPGWVGWQRSQQP